MKIYLDLDGVFADFDSRFEELFRNVQIDRHSNDIWKHLASVPSFFANVELMPESTRIISMLQHHDLEFLTALPIPTGTLVTADADKRGWVAKHISRSMKVNTVVGGRNKINYLKTNPGAVLIDDYQRNITLWNDAGGIGILHTSVTSTIEKLDSLGLL